MSICFSHKILILVSKIVLILLLIEESVTSYKITNVMIISRHNIRTPFKDNLEKLNLFKFRRSGAKPDQLTQKGAIAEEAMARHFRKMFVGINLINNNECVHPSHVYILANNSQRAIDTAKIFTAGVFQGCNYDININDDIFKAVIRNPSKEFRNESITYLRKTLKSLNFTNHYSVLDNIFHFNETDLCKVDEICDLTGKQDDAFIEFGCEPNFVGLFFEAQRSVDTIIMAYYNGMDVDSLYKGIPNEKDFMRILLDVSKAYLKRYGSPAIARDVARPLIKRISDLFKTETVKISVLVGHDTTIQTIISALGIGGPKGGVTGELEGLPVGSKLVFQKLYDEKTGRNFLRANLLYHTKEQLRAGLKPDEDPEVIELFLESCANWQEQFCIWDDFIKAVHNAL